MVKNIDNLLEILYDSLLISSLHVDESQSQSQHSAKQLRQLETWFKMEQQPKKHH